MKNGRTAAITSIVPRAHLIFWWITRIMLIVCACYALFFLMPESSSLYKPDGGTKFAQALAALGLSFVWELFFIFGRKCWIGKLDYTVQTWLMTLVLVACCVGSYLYFYEKFWWFDLAAHVWSGVISAVGGYEIFIAMNYKNPKSVNKQATVMFSVMFVFLIALLWEIWEFSVDCLLGSNMQIRYERLIANWAQNGGTVTFKDAAGNLLDPENSDTLKNGFAVFGKALSTADINSSLYDTMSDIIVAVLGGIAGTVFIIKTKYKERFCTGNSVDTMD